MMVSDAKKRADAKWAAANMKIVATKVRVETAEEFARLCKLNGDSMHSVLKRCIEEYIEQNRPMK